MRRNTKTVVEQHHDWLTQVETDGPFLALPVVKDIWPQGVERLGDADDRMVIYKQAYVQWQRAFDTFSGSLGPDSLIWPRGDGLMWLHLLRFNRSVVTV